MGDLERLREVRITVTCGKGDNVFARKLILRVEENCSMMIDPLVGSFEEIPLSVNDELGGEAACGGVNGNKGHV